MGGGMNGFIQSLSHKYELPMMLFTAASFVLVMAVRRYTASKLLPKLKMNVMLASAYLGMGLVLSLQFLALFHFGCAGVKAKSNICLTAMKRAQVGLFTYMQDYDDTVPPSNIWETAVSQSLKPRDEPIACPSAVVGSGYSLNAEMSTVKLAVVKDHPNTVLLFESQTPVRSTAGGKNNVDWQRHGGAPNFGMADGGARWLSKIGIEGKAWKP